MGGMEGKTRHGALVRRERFEKAFLSAVHAGLGGAFGVGQQKFAWLTEHA
jgi:hypothetical protein